MISFLKPLWVLVACIITVILPGCGNDVEESPIVRLTRIDVVASPVKTRGISELTLAKGNSQSFIATGHYSNGASQDITQLVTWQLSNEHVAHINAQGILTGIEAGTTHVTANYDKVTSNRVEVAVTPAVITEISLTPPLVTVAKGQTESLTAMATYSDGTSANISDSVSWGSTPTGIVALSPSGQLSGVEVGKTWVTASKDNVISNEVTVEVTPAVITEITVTPPLVSVAKGQIEPLTAMATYSDRTSANISNSVTWSVDSHIATVTGDGKLTGVTVGKTTVTASKGTITSNSVAVDVTPAVIAKIVVPSSAVTLAKGQEKSLTATVIYSDGSSAQVSDAVSWRAVNTSIATVTVDGKLTGVVVGKTTLTASKGSIVSNSVAVEVTPAVITKIVVTPPLVSVAKGQTKLFTAMATYSDGTSANISKSVTWNTDSRIAPVTSNGKLTGVAEGSTTLTASKDGITSNTVTVDVTAAVVTEIMILPSPVTVAKGQEVSLTARVFYSDNTSKDTNDAVSWRVVNTGIATATMAGKLTGVEKGTTELTASKDGITSEPVVVEVTAAVVTEIMITPSPVTVAKGQKVSLTARVFYSDTTSPEMNNFVTWHSVDPNIATVTPEGVLTGVKEGSTTLTASKGDIVSNTVTVTVTAAVITKLTLTPSPVKVAKGQTKQLTVGAIYSDNRNGNVTSEVTWEVVDTDIATVTQQGVLTGVVEGSTQLTASKDGITSNTVAVEVTAAVVTEVTVEPTDVTLAKGQETSLSVTVTYSDGTVDKSNDSVSWHSKDPSIATVDADGRVVGVTEGSTALTASKDSITSKSVTLKVTAAVLEQIVVRPADVTLAKGQTQQLKAIGTYSDGRTPYISSSVTWQSQDPSIATVDANGQLVGVTVGNTTVTASKDGITSEKVTVEVTAAVITDIAIDPSSVSVAKGQTQQLTAMATYSDGTDGGDITSEVIWDTDNTNIATVTQGGLLMGAAEGSTTVTAQQGNISDAIPVSVAKAVLSKIVITPASLTMQNQSNGGPLTATGIYSDNTDLNITDQVDWRSNSGHIDINQGNVSIMYGAVFTDTVTASLDNISSDPITVKIVPPLDACNGTINDTSSVSSFEYCLKVREITHNSQQLRFTSTPSKSVMETLGYAADASDSNRGDSYAAIVVEDYTSFGARSAAFTQTGANVQPDGVNGQYDRWCQKLAELRFGGNNNWRRATLEELQALYQFENSSDQGMKERFGWPTSKEYWSSSSYAELPGGVVFEAVSLSKYNTVYTYSSSEPLYASCVSEQ